MVRTRLALAWLVAAVLAAAALVALRAHVASARSRPVPLARPAVWPAPGPSGPSDRPDSPDQPDPPDAPDQRRPPDAAAVRAVLLSLDRARATAYADPLSGDPDAWDARSCPCHDEDVRRLRALARDGLALRAAAVTLLSVGVARAGPGSVDAVVVDRLAPYVAVDRTGRMVRRWPASGPRRWRITFVRTSGRWLVGALARAP